MRIERGVAARRARYARQRREGPIDRCPDREGLKVPHVEIMLGDDAEERLIALEGRDYLAIGAVIGGDIRGVDHHVERIAYHHVGHVDEIELAAVAETEVGRDLLRTKNGKPSSVPPAISSL